MTLIISAELIFAPIVSVHVYLHENGANRMPENKQLRFPYFYKAIICYQGQRVHFPYVLPFI